MIRWLRALFSTQPHYEYGKLDSYDSRTFARRDILTGKVEFQLWPKGHWKSPEEDYWVEPGPGHVFLPITTSAEGNHGPDQQAAG